SSSPSRADRYHRRFRKGSSVTAPELTPNQLDVLRAAARGSVKRVGARDMWGGRGVTPNVTELVRAGLLYRPEGCARWVPTRAGLRALKAKT
ncbi:MAG: hypothetical protein M3Q39_00510, partial [Actinomycetota bacterium]|nr:hypothetical protein [Actinomycetota bacterium]